MNIEIVTTVNNSLKETDLGHHVTCLEVLESILRSGNSARVTVCESLDDLKAVVAREPDCVILAAKYISIKNEENLWLSEYFLNNKITFSGSDREAFKFDIDKISAKVHLANMRIKTARHFTASPKQFLSEASLPLSLPLFIKSMHDENGNGIDEMSLVNSIEEFEAKVQSIYTTDKRAALVEEYLVGRNFTTAILCHSNGEISASSVEILKQDDKQQNTERLVKIENSHEIHNIDQFAKTAFRGLGLKGFGLIDVKMDKHAQCFFMQADLIPDISFGRSYFLKACEIASNLTYDQVISLTLEECLSRARSEKIHNKVLKQRNQHWPRASVTRGF